MVSIPDTGMPRAELEALIIRQEGQIREMADERIRLLAEVVALKDRAEEHARCCVAALVTDPTGRLLLVRSKKPGRGWELPGGKVRSAETWREALVREVREETGLTISDIGEPRVLDGQPVEGAAFTSIILVATARAEGEPIAGDDAAEARWFAATDIPWAELSRFASTAEVKRWTAEQIRELAGDATPILEYRLRYANGRFERDGKWFTEDDFGPVEGCLVCIAFSVTRADYHAAQALAAAASRWLMRHGAARVETRQTVEDQ